MLVIDLEATCWADKKRDEDGNLENEIIEIGATLLTNSSKQNIGFTYNSFQTFVKPVVNPMLSPYCIELTKITQKDVEPAPTFPEALKNFLDQVYFYYKSKDISNLIFASWGDYDRKQFLKDCALHKVAYPFGPHVNIKNIFAEINGFSRGCGVLRALKHEHMKFEGVHHRGIDDSFNIARIVQKRWNEIVQVVERKN